MGGGNIPASRQRRQPLARRKTNGGCCAKHAIERPSCACRDHGTRTRPRHPAGRKSAKSNSHSRPRADDRPADGFLRSGNFHGELCGAIYAISGRTPTRVVHAAARLSSRASTWLCSSKVRNGTRRRETRLGKASLHECVVIFQTVSTLVATQHSGIAT